MDDFKIVLGKTPNKLVGRLPMTKERIVFLVPATIYTFRWEESPWIEVLKAILIKSQWLYERGSRWILPTLIKSSTDSRPWVRP